ncbi:MAG: glutaredoxin [Parcubacteria group bacterium]|nr:glutaredoxin [Parcubacteria group bacterium]
MKKLIAVIAVIAVFSLIAAPVYAQETLEPERTVIEVFERDDCSHCRDFFAFIDDLAAQRNDFTVRSYDLYTPEGRSFFDEATDALKLVKGTPIIYVNGAIIQGFESKETTGERIIELLDAPADELLPSLREVVDAAKSGKTDQPMLASGSICDDGTQCAVQPQAAMVRIPFTDKIIDPGQYSLPVLAAILGTVDGFNPCAMWVLVMFLAALVAINNRRKMLQVIGLFLLAEATMYYLILSVWLYAWDFIGLDHIVTPLVGLVAIAAGAYFLREFYRGEVACRVANPEQRKRISEKIKDFASKPITMLGALGIIAIAFSVNIFEFACSIGIPQTFTKILDLANLSWITKQLYNAIYIIGYMLDDFIVFGIALYSFEKIGITAKYSRISHLIGGLLMVLLGLILLAKPSLLVL